MTIVGLLQELAARDVIIQPDGDVLHVDAPRGVLTAEVREMLANRKQELLRVLSSNRIEIVLCLGDQCGSKVVLINGKGYCPSHQMTITVHEGSF
ncbi:MAG: hypothetical protein AABO41_07440 [Acidobacteriota bacterium]